MNLTQVQEVRLTDDCLSKVSLERALKNAINSLYERLRDERIDFASVSRVYFRLEPSVNWKSFEHDLFSASGALQDLAISRFPKAKSFLLFCSDYEHELTDLNGQSVPNSSDQLNNIRDLELQKLVNESGALYEANKYHYFRLPSGQTADYFLRAGNCLAKMEAVYIFSFWALPSLRGTNLIICDTWSISTLGMFLAQLGERYSGQKYECQYLSKYLDDDIDSANEVEELLEQASYGNVVPLFLVSAVSSGRSLSTYVNAYAVLFSKEQPKILVLYLLSTVLAPDLLSRVDFAVLCHFGPILKGRGLQGFKDDISLTDGQQTFTIDSKTYFPRYFEAREHNFKVTKFTKSSKPFFERYAGHDLFSVCKDGASNTKLNRQRHHAFHVDIYKLVQTDEFRGNLEKTLGEHDLRPTHIIHLMKPADQAMASVLKTVLASHSHPVRTMCMTSFREINRCEDILRELNNSEAQVLFVDAMYISGQSTAQDFQKGLREGLAANESKEHKASIWYLIGLLRPDLSSKISSEVNQMIRRCCPTRNGSIQVAAVETILLPNWDGQDCPWCAEKKLHSLLLQKHSRDMSGDEKAHIEERKDLLTNCRKHGLKSDLFFKLHPKHQFLFGQASLWFDCTNVKTKGMKYAKADAMLAVASAVQYWRDDYTKLPPAQYLLDQQTCFSVNKYNDTFLRAAIWRSLKRREVDTFRPEQYRKELLNKVFDAGGKADDVNEFVLGWEAALLLGRYLPRIVGSVKFDVLENYLRWTALAR